MVIKKFMIIMFVIVLSSLSVFGYGGSGTEISPYTIGECNDFHLLNIDEDYTSKVWIQLSNNIDCSTFNSNFLINQTINGLHLEGNGFEVYNYTISKLMRDLNVGSESVIQNINFNNSKFFGVFNNVYYDTQDGYLRFINYSHYDSVSSATGYNSPYFVYSSHIDANNVTFYLNRVKINVDTSIYEGWTPLHIVDGLNDQFDIHFDKVYYNISASSGSYDAFLTGKTSQGDEYKNIYANEIDFILRGVPTDRYLLITGRQNHVNNIFINNSIWGIESSGNSNNFLLGMFSTYGILNVSNNIIIGDGREDLYTSTTITTEKYNNNYQIDTIENTLTNWTKHNISELYSNTIYSGFDNDIFTFEEGKRPALNWLTEDETPPLTIDCYNLNYVIYEYSNLTYDINCETNELFTNYTFLGSTSSLSSSTLDIEGITYNITEDIYPLNICVDSGTCKDYNITITSRTIDDINPVCSPLPDINIYENTDFNISVNCSDRYTNLTLIFSSFPVNISKQIETNQNVYINNVTLTPPNNDFTLYMTANDSRGNFITLNKFYTISEEVTPLNESFKTDLNNTPTSILFIGFVFFFLILFVLGVMFKIPVFLIFSGIAFLFMGILVLELLSILGVIVILFGVVLLGYALIMFNND